jgi:hypothetical protein
LHVLDRISAFAAGNINYEEKNPAARNVSEEFVTEANPAMPALN